MNVRPLLLVVCMTAMPATLMAQKIKFTAKPLPKNSEVTLAETNIEDMTNTTYMEGQFRNSTSHAERRVVAVFNVLQSSTKGVVKARVHYEKHQLKKKATSPMGDQELADPSPLEGNTYMLAVKDGQLIAKDEKGEDPSQEELQMLMHEFASEVKKGALADPHMKMREQFAGREMTVGESVTLDKEVVSAMLGGDDSKDGPPIRKMVLKLVDTRTISGVKCAVFELKIYMDEDAMAKRAVIPNTKVASVMKGEVIMGIDDSWSRSFKIGGAISFAARQDSPNGYVSLDARMELDVTRLATFTLPTK